jgi:cytochrome b561/polyisoprenoid-binding protein YceI
MGTTSSPRLQGPANTHQTYGSVERALHWAVALLLITGGILGKIAYEWPYDTSDALSVKAQLFSAHKTVGVTVFFLALIRIGWALSQPRPRPLHSERVWETRLASTVHWLLYGSLVLVPLTGWMHHAASAGFAPIWWPFGQGLPFVPKDPILSATLGELHELFVKVLIVALLLHVAGALKHVFVDRDLTLPRMWSGRDPGVLPPPKKDILPVLLAGLIWAAALIIGLYAARMEHPPASSAPSSTASAQAETAANWRVLDGTLGITVSQMAQAVSGTFSDWTAEIDFDETQQQDGRVGTVSAIIDTTSLRLGSVSNDAQAADFLNTQDFPTATFTADILRQDDAYIADGTLSLRGETVPVSLPFSLDVSDGLATMAGEITLDRRDFGIGEAYPDESNVGFTVQVNIKLTAEKV